jgi:phosphatidylglycerophosphatase A
MLIGMVGMTTRQTMHSWWDRGSWWIASVGGVGLSPIAPGTAGSLVACLVVWWLHPSTAALSWLIVGGTLLAVLVTPGAERIAGRSDPGLIVIDEVVGMWITLLAIPQTVAWMAVGLFFFRLFDIWKPYPIRPLERIRSPWGVVLDDLGAGCYGFCIVHSLILLWKLAGN